jgi:hypothetical protein
MEQLRTLACTICGEYKLSTQRWYLALEDHWQDKLKILHWDDHLAEQEGVHRACSPAHLQELVVHWMTTGSMDYPFARTVTGSVSPTPRRSAGWTGRGHFGEGRAKPIGELAIHRESMQRVLSENPESLRSILDALLSALQRDIPCSRLDVAWAEGRLREASH